MFNKLFRKYNQNRNTIWTIIIFIAFFVILLHTVFAIIRSNRSKEQEEMLNAYYQNLSNTSNNNSVENKAEEGNTTQVPAYITTSSSAEEIINYFVKLCNNNKVEEAYNMISKDCKTVLFPTINDFKNNYYNKVFTQQKDAKLEESMYEGDIYKVTYVNNILANGGYKPEDIIEDYIYITEENQEMKISLNKFLYIKEINKTGKSNDISIKVLKKKVYIDYEEYQIQILNNTTEKICVTPDEKKVYLLDENNVKYISSIDELQNDVTLVEPNKTRTIELTFYKSWRFKKKCKIYYVFRDYYQLCSISKWKRSKHSYY